ncbi:hypothetical protein [Anaerovorax odorimutans]|uniref:hypothetical protein n=1 Tax=Anaerovorax odorimutans TaxID=109327 RepID=UPI000405DEFE|nr:hypothetical protein [Anaerovorax odorimutans]
MTDKIDDISVIETLRTKTEEIDMDQYLKRKLGGYTKQSVLEYLNVLRKQQQTTTDTFYQNLQTIYNEKETIKNNNETLQNRLNKIESEYKNLIESIKTIKLENSDLSPQDIIALKSTNAANEEELKKSNIEKVSLENKIKHLKNSINDLNEKLKQCEHEISASKEIIIKEKQESKELRNKISELSTVIEDNHNEINYLKSLQSEGQIAELTLQVNSLTNQLITQTEVMSNLNSEVNIKEKTITTLTSETELQKQMINDLNKTIEELQKQNDKLLLTNTTFSKQLQDNFSKTIDLINEKSDITIDKISAYRKLDEANSKIAVLEMKIQKSNKLEENIKLEELKGC